VTSRILWLVGLLSLAVNVGVVGTAAYRWCGSRHDGGACSGSPCAGEKALHQELELTAEQARQFEGLAAGLDRRLEAQRSQMRRLRKDFTELLGSDAPDQQAIRRKLAEISGIQLEIQQAVAEYLLAQKRILTPPQRRKFAELLVRRFEREDHHGSSSMAPLPLGPARPGHAAER
jgi:Spy/CpxP family protein refolding chaperone